VLATSVSGTPNIPKIDQIENFAGKVLHSSRFAAGKEWVRSFRGRVRHRH
jgi:cation diffusion facilitator CzcD-associated flavoprotein CzcO